jgi:hypothetical protein
MRKRVTSMILLIFLFVNINVTGQNNQEPLWYLNSRQFDFNKVFINPMRIDSININKQKAPGEILIFTKNNEFTFYRLIDVLKKYTNVNGLNESILFRINGKIIEDSTSLKIDDTYFIYVETERLYGIKYLSNQYLNLTIVNIDLETKKREPKTYIRSSQELIDKLKNK